MDDRIRRQIAALDPVKDHQRIVHLSYVYEFPWDTTRALELALFRTFAVPSIGALLDATGEFGSYAQKRYDDTTILIAEFCQNGYDSVRGRQAIRTMNRIHGHFSIAQEDYLYVLSTFICEPPRWMQRFAWRPYSRTELLANFYFWREVGHLMNIPDIPDTYEAMEAFNVAFERTHFRFTEASARVARATRELFARQRLPGPLARFGFPALHALLDEPLLDAFGFPHPSRLERAVLEGVLRARAMVVKWGPRKRNNPLVQEQDWPTYPGGYEIEKIGPANRSMDTTRSR